MGEILVVFAFALGDALGKTRNSRGAVLQQRHRARFAQQVEGTLDLLERRLQPRQRAAPLGAAEEVVEGLLDLREVYLHLAGELA